MCLMEQDMTETLNVTEIKQALYRKFIADDGSGEELAWEDAQYIEQESTKLVTCRLRPMCDGKSSAVIMLAGLSLLLSAVDNDFEIVKSMLITWWTHEYGEGFGDNAAMGYAVLGGLSPSEALIAAEEAHSLALRFEEECVGLPQAMVFGSGLMLAIEATREVMEEDPGVALSCLLFLLKTFEPRVRDYPMNDELMRLAEQFFKLNHSEPDPPTEEDRKWHESWLFYKIPSLCPSNTYGLVLLVDLLLDLQNEEK
jgi:hypothetical protein